MKTYTEKQLEVLVEILQWPKIEVPSLSWALNKKGKNMHVNEVRKAVAKLKKDKLVDVEEISHGKRTFYKIMRRSGYDSFKRVSGHLLKSSHELEFIRSKYVQSLIDEKFMDYFAVGWCREYYRILQKQGSKFCGKDVDEMEGGQLRDWFYAYFDDDWTSAKRLTKEKLLKIIRLSPSGLYNFLFPEKVIKEG